MSWSKIQGRGISQLSRFAQGERQSPSLFSVVMDAVMNYVHCPEDDFYAILGCSESSQVEQILAEYKVRALNLHPDKQPNDPQAVVKFQKLQEAKDTLTDKEKRKDYDRWRQSGLAISFQEWQKYRTKIHQSMHWANQPRLPNMLTSMPADSDDKDRTSNSQQFQIIWKGFSESDIVRKFRNYEI